jgi:RNA polymerase sigma-70 factor (ECF subfamily)
VANRDQLLGELMKEAQGGNETSYQTLLSEVYMFLESYLNSKVYNKSQVDDVLQEILLAVHNSRHTFDTSKSFMSWLLAISHYKITDHLRLQFKQKAQELEDSIVDTNPDALNALIDNQSFHILHQAINELDEKPKKIITLLKLEGLKISEVAIKLNLSESNVKVIAHRAYQGLEIKLRSKL